MSENILKKIKTLTEKLNHHNYLYHTLDQQEISDREYDKLFDQLIELENNYPNYKQRDSPTLKVGGAVLESFEKIAHKEPMLSLQNTYNEDDIISFDEKIRKQAGVDNISYYCSPKFDGIAIELIFQNGQLTRAITRGDGVVGENVFSNVKSVRSLPLLLNDVPEYFEVRGEILFDKQDFSQLNKKQREKNLPEFANARNAAGGTLRQLDSKIASARPLKLFCYAPGFVPDKKFDSQSDFEKFITRENLPTVLQAKSISDLSVHDLTLSYQANNVEDVITYYNKIQGLRQDLPFEIDGIVIKVNSYSLQDELGFVARSPRWAFAAKFETEKAWTRVSEITIQVGRTGAMTPVAIMEPVNVGGVTITHATLHNQDEINRKDIRINDRVLVHRAGDVIPEIISVDHSSRSTESVAFEIPTNCPVCETPSIIEDDEAIRRCPNTKCPSVVKGNLTHFVSRNAMNIDKVGEKLIETLYDNQLIEKASDLYKLKEDQILNLDRQGKKSTENILKSIANSKTPSLAKFLYSLGIRFVGEQTAKTIAKHVGTVKKFLDLTEEELLELPDIGPKVAESVNFSLRNKDFVTEVLLLLDLGVEPKELVGNANTQSLGSIAITGSFEMKRKAIQEVLENAGWKVSSQVSKSTNILLCGEKAGSKKTKAEGLGIEISSVEQINSKYGYNLK